MKEGAGATIQGPLSQFRGGGAAVLTGQSCPRTMWTNNKQRYRGSHLFALFIKNTAIISIFTLRKSDGCVKENRLHI